MKPPLVHILALTLACALALVACDGTSTSSAAPAPDTGLYDTGDSSDTAVDARTDTTRVDVAEDDATSETDVETPDLDPEACNGSRELCERPFDQVAYATTHNAFAVESEGFAAHNQLLPMSRQLEDGIRGLMLDIHDESGVPHLCHGICLVGQRPLTDGLVEINDFVETHPRQVVTLILETYVEPDAVESAFVESGLIDHVYAHSPDGGWPTLGAMIDDDARVVVLTDRGGGSYPWYIDVWDVAFETPFSVEHVEDFDCSRNRGSADNELFILNHFVTNPIARPENAEVANEHTLLLERARGCEATFGQLPSFVTVDYYSIGDVLDVVDELNGL